MITRTVEYCSLNEVPENEVHQMLCDVLKTIDAELTLPEAFAWDHASSKDGRTGDGHGEVVDTFRSSLSKHVDIRKEVAQRYIHTQFGPVQMSDRVCYIATGQGENLHFEFFVNADGHNTVHFMISALPNQVDDLLACFHSRFQ